MYVFVLRERWGWGGVFRERAIENQLTFVVDQSSFFLEMGIYFSVYI